MSEEQTAPVEAPKSGKMGIKTIGIVAAIMIAEGAGVYFLVSMTGAPRTSQASIAGEEQAEREKTQEILLVEDRFQNVDSGSIWLWDTTIYVQVRNKNADRVQEIMKRREAEIKEGVSLIFRRAADRHLRSDPGLETVTRQITAYVNEVFGTDKDELPLVERVIIPKCTGINAGG
ncbi:MAG: hypothetical protein DYG94_09030 [Leptolyngbya sp. PLA3]|nr:MAG: hypothetical protein EDM82_02765 [Cyanobacteria bacterium CYA]MCE7968874.1 hypothetical protein [Leptolyngbya sp. PL-A3]